MNAPAFICTLNGPDHIYELVNPEYQKLYGKRGLIGKKVIEAMPELEGQGIIETLDRVYKTGKPYVVTERLLYLSHDTGQEPEPTYLNFSYQPIYDSEKNITGVLVFGYEVTEQVLAKKKSEENLKRILESLPQITSASSADGSDIFFNKFFFEYSGISRAEASITGWNSILHPGEVEGVLADWEDCRKTGADFYKVLQLKRKSDGMYRWHLAHLTSLKNEKDEISHWIGSATDIHEQKINEQKKDEFISIASHEMKTPLTTAKAYLQLLELSLADTNEKAKRYTQKAIHSVERLKDLISELLDVSKVQHGKLNFNFDFFDFSEMIRDAVEAIQYTSPRHIIVHTGKGDIPARGDKERLQQVILNLLSNAVKYSPGSPEIQIHSQILENGEVMVWVKDQGIGIAKNDLERIFERYFRVEGQDIHFQGLGIGLYISMEIVRRHKGRLWAESEPGKGSTFYFILPLENT
jgi:PAS domain S-box-containing protein